MKTLLNIIWVGFFLMAPLVSMGQSAARVTGKVMAPGGVALEGATVQLLKSKRSVLSRAGGRFRLDNVLLPDSLRVSFVNYAPQTFVLRDTSPLSVVLQPLPRQLEEVIVSNGYQRLPKERATGSYTFIGNADLERQAGISVLGRLDGIASGILFDRNGNRPQVTLRGLSTILNNKSPLVILDNFPYEGDLANINPDDVENITLLKDASAASIWGTRAGNGVIVITLKKGSYSKPLSMQFSAVFSTAARPNLSYLRPMAATDFIDVEQLLYSKGYYAGVIANTSRPGLSPVVELLLKKTAGQLPAAEADARINALRTGNMAKEFENTMYRSQATTRYGLSFDGGSDKTSYHVSAGMDRNISVLDAPYDRLNLYADHSFRPSARLQVNTSLYYTQGRTSSGRLSYGSLTVGGAQLPPYTRFTDDAGNPVPVYINRQPYLDTAGNGKLLDWKYYPLEEYKHNTTRSSLADLLAAVSLRYQPAPGLSLLARYQYQRGQNAVTGLQDNESFATRDLTNRFTQINRVTGAVKYIVPAGGILNQSATLSQAQNLRVQAAYNLQARKEELSLLAGGELRELRSDGTAARYYGYNDNLATVAPVDLANSYPTFINGSSQGIPNGNSVSGTLNRFTSLFANGAITHAGLYTLSASARKDQSNLFGVNTNEKGVPLWSAGAGWLVSRERFYHLDWMPHLKLRLTYGSSGNVDNSRSAVTTLFYAPVAAEYTNLVYANVSQYANPDLRWEKVYMLNAALDFSFGSVLSGSLEYYHKKGVDLFGSSPIDYTAGLGVTGVTRNVADMAGDGWDLQLNATYRMGGLSWQPSLNLSFARSRATAYNQSSTAGSAFVGNGTTIVPLVGKPVYGILSYRFAGLDPLTGDPLGYIGGVASKDYAQLTGAGVQVSDLVFSGSAVPTCWGNFLQAFRYGNWSLDLNIVWRLGYYFRRTSINYTSLFSQSNGNADFASRWMKPGDEQQTTIPSMVYPTITARDNFYSSSDVLVDKGDHIRLQFVNLGYDLPPGKSSFPLKNCRLYVNAANLGILWRANRDHLDPDYPSSLPPGINWSFGLKTNF